MVNGELDHSYSHCLFQVFPPTFPYMVICKLSFLFPLFVSLLLIRSMVNSHSCSHCLFHIFLPLFPIWSSVIYHSCYHCLFRSPSHFFLYGQLWIIWPMVNPHSFPIVSLPLFLIWSSVFFHSFSPPLFLIWSTVNPYHHCHVYLS